MYIPLPSVPPMYQSKDCLALLALSAMALTILKTSNGWQELIPTKISPNVMAMWPGGRQALVKNLGESLIKDFSLKKNLDESLTKDFPLKTVGLPQASVSLLRRRRARTDRL